MKNWLRTALFASCISPVFLSLAYLRHSTHGSDTPFFQFLALGLCGTLLALAIVRFAYRFTAPTRIKLKKLEPNDFMFVVFIFSYLVPFFSKASNWSPEEAAALALAIFVVGLYTNQVPAHPLLTVLRYKFYKAEADSGLVFILISKREIISLKEELNVLQLSSSMLIEV